MEIFYQILKGYNFGLLNYYQKTYPYLICQFHIYLKDYRVIMYLYLYVIDSVLDYISLSYFLLSHIFEIFAWHYLPLSIGVIIGYAENINTIPYDLQEIRPTVLTSVPHLFEKVFTQIMDQINNGS